MAEIIVTYREKPLALSSLDHIRWRLSLTRRGRKGSTVETWTRNMAIAEVSAFAASRRIEDLIPMRLVEDVYTEFGGFQNCWRFAFDTATCEGGELVMDVSFSCASSKAWPLHRCLLGLDWKHDSTYAAKKGEVPQ